MAEWLARQTPNHKIVGSSLAKTSCLIKNCPVGATDNDNGASVHSEMAIVLRLPIGPWSM